MALSEDEELELLQLHKKRFESQQQSSALQRGDRQVGLFARDVIEGAASLPLAVADAPTIVKRAVTGQSGLTGSEFLHQSLTKVGLPEPENTQERLVQDISQGMVGGLSVSGSKVPNIVRNVIAAATSNVAAGGARELGAPAWAQTLAGTLAGMRPGRLGLKPPKESIAAPGNEVRLATWTAANDAGYKFPPSVIDRSFTRERIESIGGKAAVAQQASLHNQQNTNALARQAAGLRPNEPITEASLANARDVAAQPYRQVAAMSPTAASALEELKRVRAEAKVYHRHADISGDPKSVKEAERLDHEAAVYEGMIDAEAIKSKSPGLLSELREARVKIAQNWDVDRALNVGTGDVRAPKLGQMLDKRGQGGMSGPLLTIAKTQQAFPDYMRETAKVSTPGVSKLEAMASLGLGYGGYHVGGLKGAVMAGLALPAVSTAARAAALHAMQNPVSQQGIPAAALATFLARQSGLGLKGGLD